VLSHVRIKNREEGVDEEGSIALNLSQLVERWMVERQRGRRLPVREVECDETLASDYYVRKGTDPALTTISRIRARSA